MELVILILPFLQYQQLTWKSFVGRSKHSHTIQLYCRLVTRRRGLWLVCKCISVLWCSLWSFFASSSSLAQEQKQFCPSVSSSATGHSRVNRQFWYSSFWVKCVTVSNVTVIVIETITTMMASPKNVRMLLALVLACVCMRVSP